jgi:hypothetical protein
MRIKKPAREEEPQGGEITEPPPELHYTMVELDTGGKYPRSVYLSMSFDEFSDLYSKALENGLITIREGDDAQGIPVNRVVYFEKKIMRSA